MSLLVDLPGQPAVKSFEKLPDKLRVIGDNGVEGSDVDFILIGGIGTSPVEEWAICSDSWRILLSEPRVRMLTFRPDMVLDNNFSLPMYLQQGELLLECLSHLKTRDGLMRPLAFMCHSLGGFLLKQASTTIQHAPSHTSDRSQALCIANAQSERYGVVLGSILGITFLGVPHAAFTAEELSQKSLLILKSVTNNISKQNFARLEGELAHLADISSLFDDIELRVLILTVYETKLTKVRGGRKKSIVSYPSTQNLILVDQQLAKTHSAREQCFGLETSHSDLCQLGESTEQPDEDLVKWIRFLVCKDSVDFIERRLRAYRIGSSSVAPSSIPSSYDATCPDSRAQSPNNLPPMPRSDEPTAGSSTAQAWEITPILNRFAPSRRLAQLPCIMMETPVRNKDFYGRESILKQLDQALLPSEALFSSEYDLKESVPHKHVVICGMGGIGKTSIAIEFAFRRMKSFDAIFWIRADETTKLDQDFSEIANRLGLEDDTELRNPVVSRELARGWLDNPKRVLNQESDIIGQAEPRWLLILDNADRPDILQDYWPISGNGSLLVTSRDPMAKTSPAIATLSIDLPPFEAEDASLLLQQLSQLDQEKDSSLKIARILGGLPLAISQMAAIIRYQYLSFSEFLERYEDEIDRKDLLEYEAGTGRQEARGNLASVWAVESLEPQAKALLEVCSLLDPDCIQERIFLDGASDIHLKHYPQKKWHFSLARADLLKRSLVRRSLGEKEYWIHRVLQDSIKAKMSVQRRREVFSAAVSLVFSAWGNTPLVKRYDTSLSKSREGLFPHIMALAKVYETVCKDAEPRTNIDLANLLHEAGWWQNERGNSHDNKFLFNLALQICSDYPRNKNFQLLGDIHYGLSAVANETNNGKECFLHSTVLLKMCLQATQENGVSDLRLAVAHNQMGMSWVMVGEYDTAIAAFKSSIQVYQGLDDYWPSMDTNPRMNMGFTYWLKSHLETASTVFEELLRDRINKFGHNDKESYRTGRVLHGLGNVRFSQGRMEESENFHQMALAHYQTNIGNNHHKTADLCYRVAQHCMRRGEFGNAIALVDQALSVWRPRKSSYIPELSRTIFLKSKLLKAIGDDAKMAALLEEAKVLRNSIPHVVQKLDGSSLTEEDFDSLVTYFSR